MGWVEKLLLRQELDDLELELHRAMRDEHPDLIAIQRIKADIAALQRRLPAARRRERVAV